jgi:hypothetical protein
MGEITFELNHREMGTTSGEIHRGREKQPGGNLIETWEKYSEENFIKKWEN